MRILLKRFSRRRWLVLTSAVVLLLTVSVSLTVWRMGLRQPVATPVIVVRQAPGALPAAPWDAAWNKVGSVSLPLAITNTPGAAARNVDVKAVTDGHNLVVRMEWEDSSKEVRTLRPQDFADAGAMQLSDQLSNACMGQLQMNAVHIWQWKADWAEGSRDMAVQYPNMHSDGFTGGDGQPIAMFDEDLYARPAYFVGNQRAAASKSVAVEHLVAQGFGTLTSAGPYPMQGQGEWQSGKWALVFTRSLHGGEGDVSLTPGAPLQAAFAVWDGKLMQRDGMKYVTGWIVMELEGK